MNTITEPCRSSSTREEREREAYNVHKMKLYRHNQICHVVNYGSN